MKRKNHTTILMLCVLAGALVLVFAAGLTHSDAMVVMSREQLDGFEYAHSIARIERSCFDWYPSALYTPDDFAAGTVTQQPEKEVRQHNQYGTYRLVLDLPANRVYGLSAYSATYSQMLWVNGMLLSQVGRPGESAEQTTHKTSYYTVYFETTENPTEIIIQRAEFVHVTGGQLYPQYLGEQALITQMTSSFQMRGNMIVGAMLMSAVFFFGIFLFFNERRHFLWYALSCAFIAVRTLYTDHKLIMVLFPGMGWELSHKLEYVATISFYVFLFFYLHRIFDWRTPRIIRAVELATNAFFVVVVILLPSTAYTRFLMFWKGFIAVYAVVLLVLCTRYTFTGRPERRVEDILVLFGYAALVVSFHADLSRYLRLDDLNLIQIGALAFLATNMLALALNLTRTEASLDEARRREVEMRETNNMLERLNQLKMDFLSNITHEMKTPLTVMSGYAQLTRWQMDADSVDAETHENLKTISLEAQRMSSLVNQLLRVSVEDSEGMDMEAISVPELLDRATALCEPILMKNENSFVTVDDDGCPPVRGGLEMILQVVMNLAANANRHTHGADIILSVKREGDAAVFTLSDPGEGIAPDLLPHVFERGRSGDGSTGLGLAICRDVVETLGGTVGVQSERGVGTQVTFTLPLYEEETGDDTDPSAG